MRPKSQTVNAKNFLSLPPGTYGLAANTFFKVRADTRYFFFRYSIDGKRHDISLGSAPATTPAAARARADELRALVAAGIDPLDRKAEKKKAAAVPTFDEYLPGALERLYTLRRWKNEKHRAQWEATLRTYASPVIGSIQISKITADDVLDIIMPIWSTKSETAGRVRGRLEAIFDLARADGLMKSNPALWKGNLSASLPPLSKVQTVSHQAALPIEKLKQLAPQLLERADSLSLAVLFGTLTAARAQEFLGAMWEEIDFKKAVWVIPAERMKAGLEHRVPLSRQALAVLDAAGRKPTGLIFPARRQGRIMIDGPRRLIQLLTNSRATMHGMRSTFRDWCEEHLIHEALAERSLAHVPESKVVRAYQRSDLLEQRRPVMQAWADEILPIADKKSPPTRGRRARTES